MSLKLDMKTKLIGGITLEIRDMSGNYCRFFFFQIGIHLYGYFLSFLES